MFNADRINFIELERQDSNLQYLVREQVQSFILNSVILRPLFDIQIDCAQTRKSINRIRLPYHSDVLLFVKLSHGRTLHPVFYSKHTHIQRKL